METQLSNLPRKDTLSGEEILPALDLSTGDAIQIKISDIGGTANVDYDLVANIVANNISGTIQEAVDAANTAGFYANIAVSAANSANGYAIASFNSATEAEAFANDSLQYSIVSESSSLVSRIVAGNLFPFDFKEDSRYWSVVSDPALQFANPITGSFPVVTGKGKVFQKTYPRASIVYSIYSTGTETLIPNRIYNLKASYRYIGGDGTYDVKAVVAGLNAAGDTVVHTEETLIAGNTNGLTWLDISLDIDSDTFIAAGAVSIKPALQLFVNSGTIDPTFQVHTIIFRDTTESSLSSDFLDATITYRNQAETFANSSFQSANAASTFALQAQLYRDQANTSAIAAFNSQVTANTHANSAGTFATAAQNSALSAAVSANTANTQASIATSAATAANNSASSANTSQTLAAGYAGAANTSANTAANQAAIATAQANIATTAAVSANSSSVSANGSSILSASYAVSSLNSLLGAKPRGMAGGSDWYTGSPALVFGTDASAPVINITTGGNNDVYPKWAYPAIPGRTYRINVEARAVGGSRQIQIARGSSNALINSSPSYEAVVNTLVFTNSYTTQSTTYTVGGSPTTPFQYFFMVVLTDSEQVFIRDFWVEDITSEVSAQSFASVANSAAVSANSSAASAATSATLSASITPNSRAKDPYMTLWNDIYTLTHWAAFSGTSNRVSGFSAQYSNNLPSAGGVQGGVTQFMQFSPGWWVEEMEVTLNSGTLRGVGIHNHSASDALGTVATGDYSVYDFWSKFGDGVPGRTYKLGRIREYTAACRTTRLYAMTHWNGWAVAAANDISAANDITIRYCGIRPATEMEIRDQTVLAPVEASVSTHNSAIAESLGRSQAAWGVNVNAGAVGSFISALAQTAYAIPVNIIWDKLAAGTGVTYYPNGDVGRPSGDVASWDRGVYSTNSISGDFTLGFTIQSLAAHFNTFLGVNLGSGVRRYDFMDFAFHCSSDGTMSVWENNTSYSLGITMDSVVGQRAWIEREGTTVRYKINNRTVRTVTGVATTAAYVCTDFYSNGSNRIQNIFFGTGLNKYSSSISLGAEEVHILNSVDGTYKKALSIVGGNATFTGELNVGAGAGARVNITSNLVRVYDANNTLRVRIGVW